MSGSMGAMLYANSLAVVVETKQEMQEVLGEWKGGGIQEEWTEDEYGEDG